MTDPRLKNHMEMFSSLFTENGTVEDPHAFLLKLWGADKEGFSNLIKESIYHSKSYRGMIECISHVAVKIGDNSIREVIEDAALKGQSQTDITDKLFLTALLLGSDKVKKHFRKVFEKAFSFGLDNPQYNDAIIVYYLKVIAFTNYTDIRDLIDVYLAHKSEQYHRKNESLELKPRERKRFQRNDSLGIKLAEAVRNYFVNGSDYLQSYLNTTDDGDGRAFGYLYCLACCRDPVDFEFFLDYYNKHTDVRLKSICIEALIYIGNEESVLSFLNQELQKFNFNKVLSKRSIDIGIVKIQRCPELFYQLLEVCFFVNSLNEDLIDKMQTFRKARNKKIASLSTIVLYNYGHANVDKKEIDNELLMLMQFSPSPAGLLSLSTM